MHAAAAEAGHLPGRVHAAERLARRAEHPAREIGLDPAERLAGEDREPHGDEGARRRVEQPMWLHDPHETVGQKAPRRGDRHDLGVLAEPGLDLAVAGDDLRLEGVGVDERLRLGSRGRIASDARESTHLR